MNELVAATESTNLATSGKDLAGSQYLTFRLDKETYGVEILKVQEIRGWSEPTQIPNAPEFIRGVMNLRGAIVPILDLRSRFHMDETKFTQHTVVIVVNVQNRTVGMIVDGVSDVVDLDEDSVKAAPDFGTSIDASFIHGLSDVDGTMVILLNVDAMLESCELIQIDKISGEES